MARIGRSHIEDFKSWLIKRRGRTGKPLATMTIRHRLSTVRTFFERIMEWDYEDAPARLFIYMSDFPALDEPLPKFLDDPTAYKFMAALAEDPNLRRRLMVELLARTGMRVGELAGLQDDAMVRKGDGHRLHIPIGKLHNDRYVPLLPMLVDLIAEYKAVRGRSRSGHLLERDDGRPFDRRTVHRYVVSVAKRAGVGHVHPHQLRHTLATQSINRGMSLEAIAALLGHRSMDMTLIYARISDDTVADAYFKVTEAVEAQYYGLSGRRSSSSWQSGRAVSERPQPVARQRSLHQTGSPRLRLRECLRAVRLLRDRTPVPHHLEAPTQARRRAWSERPSSAFRRPHRRSRRGPVSVLP